MRSDMAKVLVERTRGGGGLRFPRHAKEFAGDHTKEGMRLRWDRSSYEKHFSDLTGPLERYIESRVGFSWDKTWSEICSVLPRGVMSDHLKGHVMNWVEVSLPENRYRYSRFYVDSRGILRRRKWAPAPEPERYNYLRVGDLEYHRVNGAWTEISLSKVPIWIPNQRWTESGPSYIDRGYWDQEWCAWRKRTLSRREARRLELDRVLTTEPPRWQP